MKAPPKGGTDLGKINPLNAYKETNIRTASGGKLIVMLYDEALKQIDFAVEQLNQKAKRLDKVNIALLKAQDIITELMASLDFEKGGEIAKNLFSLYMFFNQQLIDTNIKKDPEPAQNVRKLLAELRGVWVEIIKKGVQGGSQDSSGVNIAG